MKTQIASCPHCGEILFDDTVECHGCGRVLDQSASIDQTAPVNPNPAKTTKARALPSSGLDNDTELCPNCGESCRTGLVRCWNCSAFMRPEIEASYRKMRESSRYEVEHVDLPVIDASHITEEDSLVRRVATPESYLASSPYAFQDAGGGDDFELSDDTQFGEIDDDSFDLSDDLMLTEQSLDSAESGEIETFRLQTTSFEPDASAADNQAPVGESDEPPVRAVSAEAPIEPAQANSEALQAATNESAEVAETAHDEALLKIAADEEQDIQRVRKTLRSKDTFVIYCPQGCRIRVKERHRGMTGKCPRCESEFVVPRKTAAEENRFRDRGRCSDCGKPLQEMDDRHPVAYGRSDETAHQNRQLVE